MPRCQWNCILCAPQYKTHNIYADAETNVSWAAFHASRKTRRNIRPSINTIVRGPPRRHYETYIFGNVMVCTFHIQLSPHQKGTTASSYGPLKGPFFLFSPCIGKKRRV